MPLWKLNVPRAGGLKKTSEVLISLVLAGGRIYAGLRTGGSICLHPRHAAA